MTESHQAQRAPRKMPRQARSAFTVEAIFDATLQVLLAKGSARLNTTLVAHRAGVSVGTIYQYFPNKHALLLAVLDRHLGRLAGAVERSCADHRNGNVAAGAEAAALAYLRVKAQHRDVSRALYLIAAELDGGAMIEAATLRAERALTDLLLNAGDGRFGEPSLVAQTLLATISGAVRTFYERGWPPMTGSTIERELVGVARSYVDAYG